MARDIALYDDFPATAGTGLGKSPSIWARLIEAVAASRQRKSERAVERYIAHNGGQLTDDLERQISRKFGRMAGDGL